MRRHSITPPQAETLLSTINFPQISLPDKKFTHWVITPSRLFFNTPEDIFIKPSLIFL
jgi:hypothetical protein